MNSSPLENRACQNGPKAERLMRPAGRYRQTHRTPRTGQQRRSGVILVVVLVCLTVVTTILLGAVESSLRHRVQIRTEIQLEQTYWLLDAGIDVAIAKFNQASDFEEHSFAIDAALKNYEGMVDIKVIERNDRNARVRVTAKLQGKHEFSRVTQRSRLIVLNIIQTDENATITNQTEEGITR